MVGTLFEAAERPVDIFHLRNPLRGVLGVGLVALASREVNHAQHPTRPTHGERTCAVQIQSISREPVRKLSEDGTWLIPVNSRI